MVAEVSHDDELATQHLTSLEGDCAQSESVSGVLPVVCSIEEEEENEELSVLTAELDQRKPKRKKKRQVIS